MKIDRHIIIQSIIPHYQQINYQQINYSLNMDCYFNRPDLFINFTYFQDFLVPLSHRVHRDIPLIDSKLCKFPVSIDSVETQKIGFSNFIWFEAKKHSLYAIVTFFNYHDEATACVSLSFYELTEFQTLVRGEKVRNTLLVDLYNLETLDYINSYKFYKAGGNSNNFKKKKNIKHKTIKIEEIEN